MSTRPILVNPSTFAKLPLSLTSSSNGMGNYGISAGTSGSDGADICMSAVCKEMSDNSISHQVCCRLWQ